MSYYDFYRKKPSDLERLLAFAIPEPNSGCWLWLGGVNENDYGTLRFRGSTWLSHRVSYTLQVAEIPKGMKALHICDVPCCVNPEHVRIGTQLENIRDMEAKGRASHAKGESHGKSKLTEQDVRNIRVDMRTGGVLAKIYGVDRATINGIKRGRYWKHVA